MVAVAVLLFLTTACSGKSGDLRTVSEVDFSIPVKVQIEYNGQITDTVIKYDGTNLELNYSNEKEAVGGAFVKISSQSYKITYTDMVFDGDSTQLPDSFLPKIIYNFFNDNGTVLTAEFYDTAKKCYSASFSVGNSFLKTEIYENENGDSVLFSVK